MTLASERTPFSRHCLFSTCHWNARHSVPCPTHRCAQPVSESTASSVKICSSFSNGIRVAGSAVNPSSTALGQATDVEDEVEVEVAVVEVVRVDEDVVVVVALELLVVVVTVVVVTVVEVAVVVVVVGVAFIVILAIARGILVPTSSEDPDGNKTE